MSAKIQSHDEYLLRLTFHAPVPLLQQQSLSISNETKFLGIYNSGCQKKFFFSTSNIA